MRSVASGINGKIIIIWSTVYRVCIVGTLIVRLSMDGAPCDGESAEVGDPSGFVGVWWASVEFGAVPVASEMVRGGPSS